MKENPFTTIINELTNRSKSSIDIPIVGIGSILSPPPNIKVKYGDLVLDKDNLYVADYLLTNYQREYELTGEGITTLVQPIPPDPPTITETWGMTSTILIGNIKLTDTLKSGDLVALISTQDKQTFIIVCKVQKL